MYSPKLSLCLIHTLEKYARACARSLWFYFWTKIVFSFSLDDWLIWRFVAFCKVDFGIVAFNRIINLISTFREGFPLVSEFLLRYLELWSLNCVSFPFPLSWFQECYFMWCEYGGMPINTSRSILNLKLKVTAMPIH
jgi:hypothetical protein